MTDRLPCRTKGCAGTILPATAARTEGYCMPCVRKEENQRRRRFILANRVDVDLYVGVTDPVDTITIFHRPRAPDELERILPPPRPIEEVYQGLGRAEVDRLLSGLRSPRSPDETARLEEVSGYLGGLTDHGGKAAEALVENGLFHPGFAFRGASAEVRDELLRRLEAVRRSGARSSCRSPGSGTRSSRMPSRPGGGRPRRGPPTCLSRWRPTPKPRGGASPARTHDGTSSTSIARRWSPDSGPLPSRSPPTRDSRTGVAGAIAISSPCSTPTRPSPSWGSWRASVAG